MNRERLNERFAVDTALIEQQIRDIKILDRKVEALENDIATLNRDPVFYAPGAAVFYQMVERRKEEVAALAAIRKKIQSESLAERDRKRVEITRRRADAFRLLDELQGYHEFGGFHHPGWLGKMMEVEGDIKKLEKQLREISF